MKTTSETTGTERAATFRPGFAWGLAAGAVAVVVIVAAAAVAVAALYTARFGAAMNAAKAPVVRVEAVGSGKPWFSVRADGRGTLEAWAGGESGSGGHTAGWPEDSVGYFTIGNVGLVDGVRVSHTARLFVTPRTKLLLGGKPYTRPGEWFVGNDERFRTRKLAVEFHRAGLDLVADTISASAETSRSPFRF